MVAFFKTVGIYSRLKNASVMETTLALIDVLKTCQQNFIVEKETAFAMPNANFNVASKEELASCCDLLIVVGGDGSLLQAVHSIAKEIPILGINRGRLGFLTDIIPKEISKIKNILQGQYTLEKRFLLNATISLSKEIEKEGLALNEVALIPDSMPHMIEFEIFVNDQFVCSQDSDGLIVATPTGSTAYALSGGGPILHPELDAIVLVPMFAHALSQRPIVLNGKDVIKLVISPNNSREPRISCDNQQIFHAPRGSHIVIQKKLESLKLIHPLDYNYYETLRSKLHWGRKLQYSN